jgi:adenylate cyclase
MGTLKTEFGQEAPVPGVRNPRTLRDRFELKQKELNLVLAIDRIRDTAPEPSAMLSAIANALANQLPADLCLLYLVDRETGKLELKAASDRSKHFDCLDPETARDLAQRALEADGVVIGQGDELPSALGLTHLSGTAHPSGTSQLAGVSIALTRISSPGRDLQMGVLLLARSQPPFDQDDVALLKIAESQIDSAVVQAHAYYELQQRNRELETIYRVDHIRDQNLPFDEMLNAVLHELRATIQAEAGFIMLYDLAQHRLRLRTSTHDDLFWVSPYYDIIDQIANEALHQAQLVCYNDLGYVLRSVMGIPLILHNEIIGVLGVVNCYGPRGFDAEDRRLLSAIASQMDTAIFESLERRRLRQVLGRSVDPRVLQRLLATPEVDFLKGERSVLSVLYADIRGSTRLAERTDPESLVGFINDYLSRMTEVILAHEGTLDKFVGDEVMALFGAPFPQPDHALRAVRVGLAMQEAHQVVMGTWQAHGIDAAPIGVGIATGELIVGEMGSAQRTDYTVIGRAANLGARICAVAKAGQVLVSQATYDLVKKQVEATPIAGVHLKGVDHDVTVYHITHVRN